MSDKIGVPISEMGDENGFVNEEISKPKRKKRGRKKKVREGNFYQDVEDEILDEEKRLRLEEPLPSIDDPFENQLDQHVDKDEEKLWHLYLQGISSGLYMALIPLLWGLLAQLDLYTANVTAATLTAFAVGYYLAYLKKV